MSSLKVLLIGDNPNIILIASRFQLAKSVDLFHISDSTSNSYIMETLPYGKEQFTLDNHYHSIESMLKKFDVKRDSLDLIILSSNSLQDLSNLSVSLLPLVDNNTKIFIESTGSIQLEPFVRMSMNGKFKNNILSMISNFDIRQIKSDDTNNIYREFDTFGDGDEPTFYLGDSSVEIYTDNTRTLLNTFQRLFMKLFPNVNISTCESQAKRYLSLQWSLALTQICFDPLLIIFEELNPRNLKDQILAKPLISGLISETLTIISSMKIKLDNQFKNEDNLLKYWEQRYAKHKNSLPSLVYRFVNQIGSLNIDLVWLQIILIADDHNIKTPYLEFLYSIFSQLKRINQNESTWYKRITDDIKIEDNNAKEELHNKNNIIDDLKNQIFDLNTKLSMKTDKLIDNETNLNNLQQKLQSLQKKENEYQSQIDSLKVQITDLMQVSNSQQIPANNSVPNDNNCRIAKMKLNSQTKYNATGTPDLNDLQDLAVFGVTYNGESPSKADSNVNANHNASINSFNNANNLKVPPVSSAMQQSASSNGSNTSQNLQSLDSNTSRSDDTTERELELKRKELELQERELELQRRALQQQQQQQQYAQQQRQPNLMMMNGNMNSMPPMNNNNMNNMNKKINNGNARNMHGASPNNLTTVSSQPNMMSNASMISNNTIPVSSNNFIDPISSNILTFNNNNTNPNYPQPQRGSPPSQQNPHGYHPHTIKPTSRKNRNSNMPNLRNPSNTNVNSFQTNMMGPQSQVIPPTMHSHSRLNSLSSQSMQFSTQLRQQIPLQQTYSKSFNNINSMNKPTAANFDNPSSNTNINPSSKNTSINNNINGNNNSYGNPTSSNNNFINNTTSSQRQPSSASMDINNVSHLSTSSVIHNNDYQNMNNNSSGGNSLANAPIVTNAAMNTANGTTMKFNDNTTNHVPIQLGTPTIPQSAPNLQHSPASFISNDTTDTNDSEKKKKKKFGNLFKKKNGKK